MSLELPIEKELLERVKQGEEHAFRQIFQRYKNKLFAYSYTITKSEVVAEEIVQDVFVKVWTHRERIDTQYSFDAYLFKITKNHTLNFLKKAARDQKIQQELIHHFQTVRTENTIEDSLIIAEYQQIFNEAINQLPPRRKLVFRMSRIEGMTHAEIAQSLSLSVGTVKIQIVRALKSIKAYLRSNSDIVLFFIWCIITLYMPA